VGKANKMCVGICKHYVLCASNRKRKKSMAPCFTNNDKNNLYRLTRSWHPQTMVCMSWIVWYARNIMSAKTWKNVMAISPQ